MLGRVLKWLLNSRPGLLLRVPLAYFHWVLGVGVVDEFGLADCSGDGLADWVGDDCGLCAGLVVGLCEEVD